MRSSDFLRIRGVAAIAAAIAVTGCGSDDKGGGGSGGPGGCTPPVLDGSTAGASGTATLTGTGTLPDGIADGLEVQVEVGQGGASYGVLPENLFAQNDRICGKTFRYTVRKLAAGTYRLEFVVFDPSSDSLMPKYEGQGPSDFTIADGQTLMLDTVFALK